MKRLWKFTVSIAVIAAIGWATCASLNAKADPLTEHGTYIVHVGDTLWDIVCANHRYDGRNVREVVYQITQLNGLKESEIQPGQAIKLP